MFECSFDANPVMYDGIRWAKMAKANDEEVSLSPAASSRISIDWDDNGGNRVTSRLIIRNVTVQDAGKIFCLVSNGYGKEAKEETYLLVKRKNDKPSVLHIHLYPLFTPCLNTLLTSASYRQTHHGRVASAEEVSSWQP